MTACSIVWPLPPPAQMNPMFTQVGAAYATDARSDEGVYWTMVFRAP